MKILIPLLVLFQLGSVNASLVGIMDSGTDITHPDLVPKVWFNPNEKPGNVDIDGDGLPGDVNGWDFIAGDANPFDAQYTYLIDNDVKTFLLYYSHYETKTVSPDELTWLKAHSKDDNLMNKVNFVGGYIHGTHVAGISTINVPNAKILALKVIPTVYQELPPAGTTPPNSLVLPPDSTTPLTVDDFKKELLDSTQGQVDQMTAMNSIIAFHKVDVVNQSFGIGHADAMGFIKTAFTSDVKRDPTDAELNALVDAYMAQLIAIGPKMFQAAPNSIFVVAAGNDTVNIDQIRDYPADIQAPNKIVVAATYGYTSLADFSNYGANNVDVAAPGVAITSTAPTNTYIPLSGTSQAAPFVTNTIAQIKDINPSINLAAVKAIVFGTVDVKPWLQGKVRTSGIVNKSRAARAAFYSKSMNINAAIARARKEIADVAVPKSFDLESKEKLDFAFRPVRQSLLIKKLR